MVRGHLVDISWPLNGDTLVYPGDPKFALRQTATYDHDGYSMQTLVMGSHTGTHVDAPAHLFAGGMTVDRLPLNVLFGPARVLDARPAGRHIDAAFLSTCHLAGAARLLFRTDNEDLLPDKFNAGHSCLTKDGAEFIVNETKARLVGIDYLSIEGGDDLRFPAHRTLLGARPPVFILEGLDLRGVEPGDAYELLCLPLRVDCGDGGPARAILVCREGP
jgi:arylformamidase